MNYSASKLCSRLVKEYKAINLASLKIPKSFKDINSTYFSLTDPKG